MSYSQVEYIEEGPPRTGMAVTAMVFGILSCVCLGVVAAIPAVICGFIAMGNARRNPARYGGYGMAVTGVVTGFIGAVLSLAIVGFMVVSGAAGFKRASTLASRSRDAANIRNLAQVANVLAADNNGRFPASQRELFMYDRNPAHFISPGSGTPELRPPFDANDPSFNIQLESHSDYLYIGADLNTRKAGTRESEIIILYDKDDHLGGRNLGFADGHAEFATSSQLLQFFDQSNRARALVGLPEVALDGPPPAAPPIAQNPPPGPNRPGMPPNFPNIPPPVRSRTDFASAEEALNYLNSARLDERRAALTYIENAPVDEALRGKVAAQLERQLGDSFARAGALRALKTWGSKENAPAVRALIPTGAPGRGGAGMGGANEKEAMDLLVTWGDKDSAKQIASLLKNFFLHDDAMNALIAFGPDAEEAVQPFTSDSDATAAKNAVAVLSKIGTEKSLVAVHRALYSTHRELPDAALAALKEMGTRLKLKPDEYMNALLARYKIDPPVGFTADTMPDPDTRQWSRQGSGRSVKSGFTVTVKVVPATYRQNPMANTPSIETGTLSFKQMSSDATNAQKRLRYEALDDDYSVTVTIVLDNFDNLAAANANNAVKKIQIKTPSP